MKKHLLHSPIHVFDTPLSTTPPHPFTSLLRIHFYVLPTSNIIWNFEKIIWKLQIYFWKFQIFFCNFQNKTQYGNTTNRIRRSDINGHERHVNKGMEGGITLFLPPTQDFSRMECIKPYVLVGGTALSLHLQKKFMVLKREWHPKHPVFSCIVLTPSAPSTPEFLEKTKKNASIFGGFEKKIVTLYRK